MGCGDTRQKKVFLYHFSFLKEAQVSSMGVPLKTEKRSEGGEILQIPGSKVGRRGLTGTSRMALSRLFPGSPPPASPGAQNWTRRCGFFVLQF